MSLFQLVGTVIALVALFGYVNYRFIKLPDAIGITAIGLVCSVVVTVAGTSLPGVLGWARDTAERVNFPEIVFHGMLGLLLFAGSLQVRLGDLEKHKVTIPILATVGVVLSTVIVGWGLYLGTNLLGFHLELIHCMLFGALVSPTDPIAVLSVLRQAGVSKQVQTLIAGESLFNDGTGVAVFLTVLGIATSGHAVSVGAIALLIATEVVGGLAVGFALGFLAFAMLRGVDSYPVETLMTLALATAGYAAAEYVHVSAPIAVVVMGLLVGNQGRRYAMSAETRARLFSFWELLDELLTLVLFGMIGLATIALGLSREQWTVGLVAIPVALIARWFSVAIPIAALARFRSFPPRTVLLLTWGGLRGAIAVALALSLPNFQGRDALIGATYSIVIFSILIQALTLGPLARRLQRSVPARTQ